MRDFELFLKKALEQKNSNGFVNYVEIARGEEMIIEKLKDEGLIKNIRHFGRNTVGFDLTYEGSHYFDEKE